MSLHLTDDEVRSYHNRSLTPQKLLAADLHLNECEDCAKRLRHLAALFIKDAVSSVRKDLTDSTRLEQDHILYEELEAFADARLDEVQQEIVQSHLEVCSQCRREAEDLGNFRNSYIQDGRQDISRVIPWRRSAASTILRMAGAAAMIALVVWAATLPVRDRVKVLEAQLKEAKEENAKLALKNSELLRQSKELKSEIAELKRSPSQASMIASLKDRGTVVSVDEQGNIAGIASSTPFYLKMAREALTKQNVETPEFLAGLIGKQGALLGESNSGRPFDLVAPVGTVLLEDRPTFRWKPLPNAKGYQVRVYDRSFKEVSASEALQDTSWTSPNSLQRGETYSWIVTAYVSDKEISSPVPPAPEARFRVLDSTQYNQLQQSKQDLAKSHLLAGLVYAQFGLLDDSVQEFQQLANENPDSQIAKKLLDRVQSLRKK